MKQPADSTIVDWNRLEQVIRRDPGKRGLASYIGDDGRALLTGELRGAARRLSRRACRVLIVTGFSVISNDGVTAETDGPPGSVYLAAILRSSGYDAMIATDAYGSPVVRAGLESAQLPASMLIELPYYSTNDESVEGTIRWRQKCARTLDQFSFVIAIERVGPSHTSDSIAKQYWGNHLIRDQFEQSVSIHERDVCHNMRGHSIDEQTAPLHLLFPDLTVFEFGPPRPYSIGIVDGGNEIGCGKIPWDVLRRAVAQGSGAQIACRIETNHTIIAGVSNWGGYALGAAVAALRGHRDAVEAWTVDRQRSLIEAMVRDGAAVDGVTKRREATVDGLPLDEYLAVFSEIRRIALGR